MQAICPQISNDSQLVKEPSVIFDSFLIIGGIFQLFLPFLASSPAAGWAFIGLQVFKSVTKMGCQLFTGKVKANFKEDNCHNPLLGRESNSNPELTTEIVKANLKEDNSHNQLLGGENNSNPELPSEIWFKILDNLDPISLGRCQRVSRILHRLSNLEYFWKKFMSSKDPRQDYFNIENFQSGLTKKKIGEVKMEGYISITSLAFANDMLFGSGRASVYLLKKEDNKWVQKDQKKLSSETFDIRVNTLIYANETLFSGSNDGKINAWDVVEDQLISARTIGASDAAIRSLCFTNGTLFSAVNNGTVEIYRKNLDEWVSVQSLKNENRKAISICCTNEKLFVLFCTKLDGGSSADIELYTLHEKKWKYDSRLDIDGGEPGGLCFAHDSNLLLSGTSNALKIWKEDFQKWTVCDSLKILSKDLCYANGMLFNGTYFSIEIYKIKNEHLVKLGEIESKRYRYTLCFANGFLFNGQTDLPLSIWHNTKT